MTYTTRNEARREARRLTNETGDRHEARGYTLGNTFVWEVVNRDRFKGE